MYQGNIEVMKDTIMEAYERYSKGEKDALLDLASFFNIPVNEERLNDFNIIDFDYENLSIKVNDEKNNVLYNGNYSSESSLLNYYGSLLKFNNVISVSSQKKEEHVYYIGDKNPIGSEITFINGDYELVFHREIPKSSSPLDDGVTMEIEYLKNVEYLGRRVKQTLFNKIYKRDDKELERVYTYGVLHFMEYDNSIDKYVFTNEAGVIYGINELSVKDLGNLDGVCAENVSKNIGSYFPLNMFEWDYPLLNDNINSAIILRFLGKDKTNHLLQIYKGSNITIRYDFTKYKFLEDDDNSSYEKTISNMFPGKITSEEISEIMIYLKSMINNDVVLNLVSSELNNFRRRIDIRKGNVLEDDDMLSPKLFIDMPFEEIYSMINENRDDYFRLIKEQFEMAINMRESLGKGQSKILKLSTRK